FAFALALAGCQEQNFFVPTEPVDTPEPGSVEGRVCDPSGRTWLADALIYTYLRTDDGHIYDTRTTYSDRNGYWLLDSLPMGFEYDVYIQYGSQILEQHTVWVGDGEQYVLDQPDCFDPLDVNVAVVTGDYDDFQLVLTDMGFANYQLVDGLTGGELVDFLMDPAQLEPYDIIFFNGGHLEEDIIYDSDGSDTAGVSTQIVQNIVDYVSSGGTVYGSDWAYDVIERGWPTRINWVGDDNIADDAQKGEYDFVSAAVSDSALAEFLGKDHVDIEFDLPVWPVIDSVDGSVSVHLSSAVEYREGQETITLPARPILASFSSGEGKVVFASFRVAKNATQDMVLSLQYMMYNL
ncbi:MAG: carboxypeptidase-like regulatory domain-containing protein, partial [Pseudomonadota bacterium]